MGTKVLYCRAYNNIISLSDFENQVQEIVLQLVRVDFGLIILSAIAQHNQSWRNTVTVEKTKPNQAWNILNLVGEKQI